MHAVLKSVVFKLKNVKSGFDITIMKKETEGFFCQRKHNYIIETGDLFLIFNNSRKFIHT